MKSKVYTKCLSALFMFFLMAGIGFSQAPPVTTVGPEVVAAGVFSVPVTVTGFTGVGNISMKLLYDATKLNYTGVTLNAGLLPANAVTTPITDQSGVFSLSYTSSVPIVLAAPGTTLFTLTFTLKPGVLNAIIPLTWSTLQGACDVTPPAPGVFTPAITTANMATYFIGGQLTVAPPVPTITGPMVGGLPATVSGGVTAGQVYTTEPGMTNYLWTVSAAGTITAGAGTNSITVTWTNPIGNQSVSVNYTNPEGITAGVPTVLIINYFPYAGPINPAIVPQFVDALPHFAAGLRVNAKAGGHLVVKAVTAQQVALSTGTVTGTGTIGDPLTPNAGKGLYQVYAVSTDNGATFGPAMWPAQTIEAQQGKGLTVQYRNDLFGVTYNQFNILADQTLMMNGYTLNGNPLTDPYTGPIPMVVHLHGAELPSNSDGGPSAWFMPGYSQLGPAFAQNASSLATYPNQQEATTMFYHPHDDGLTRINVYCGLAGFYFLRGADEEAAHLPGWSGDDKVQEVTPVGKQPTFNGATAYLPEIELAFQDRMYNVNGELFWPVEPTNPDIHPFWTPEFFGDIMVVNGKSWPYLSTAPRKYRFRMLNGCNARFLNLWLVDAATGLPGPAITVIGGEGGLLQTPAVLNPAVAGGTLLFAPGQRFDVVIDFTGIAPGTTFTLMNNANAPYPNGLPVTLGTTDRLMQFVVNGLMVSAAPPAAPADKSVVPANLRPVTPLVKLTDFAGNLSAGVNIVNKRQIILNEVATANGPAAVLVNNAFLDAALALPGSPSIFGGPTEMPLEGTTEVFQIINTTVDAHPIHIHLLQWQLVSRQAFNDVAYMAAYNAAWVPRGLPDFPAGLGYPGGAGSPLPYNTLNADGAIGGNPAVTPFLIPPVIPAALEEQGWKDNVIVLPGQVTTFVVRVAPTDRPINATPQQLMFPFDPSEGPGYVWHCHIIDHEDMGMMRPLPIKPSALRFPQITTQPAAALTCTGDNVTFSVVATSVAPITYKWQVSTNGGTTWTDLVNGGPYTGVATAALGVNPATLALNGNSYHCVLTNLDGTVTSNSALLTVSDCSISGTLKYNNSLLEALAGMTVTANGHSATTDATGSFLITGVTSGVQTITVNSNAKNVGAINSTDAGGANYWFANPIPIANVKFLAGDVNNDHAISAADALSIQRNFVLNQPFAQAPWVFWNATGSGNVYPPAFTVAVNGASVSGLNILGMCAGDFNGSYSPNLAKGASSAILYNQGDLKKVAPDTEFELAIRSGSSMEVGAVSLILDIPSDLVDVVGVTMSGSKVPVTYNVSGNELRIGWNSIVPVNVQADGDLLVLKLRTTTTFTDGKSFGLSLTSNPLNELADGRFIPIKDVALKSDKVEAAQASEVIGNKLVLTSYPNPASGMMTLYYTIPADGMVNLSIYNVIGANTGTLINEFKPAGKYTMNVDASVMPQGVYMASVRLRVGNKDLVSTIRFIVAK